MKVILKLLFACLLFIIPFIRSDGQAYTVRVSVQLAAPYPPNIDEYKNKAIITLTNLSQSSVDVFLRGSLQNDQQQFIRTKPNVFTNAPIHLGGLQTVVLQGNQIDGSYLDLNNLQTNLPNNLYSNLLQYGMIPEGYYSFCIYAYSRNSNGNYIPVSDPQAAGTCFNYNVGYIVPPRILSPLPDATIMATPTQNVNLAWTRPVGNLQNAMLVYDLYLVKVLQNEDPNVSLNNAIQYNAGIFLKQANLPNNNFQFTNTSNFQLDTGSRYVLMVQAHDLTGKTPFENNGRSETSVFTYGQNNLQPVITSPVVPAPPTVPGGITGNFNCSCKIDLSSLNKTNNNAALSTGSSFTMASLPIKISNLNISGNMVSGSGTVAINKVPVLISFKDVIVNKDGIAIAGTVTGSLASGFDFLNNGSSPTVSSLNYNSFIEQIKKNNLELPNGVGIPLPFGLNSIGAPDAVNIGVTALTITPTQAAYNAVAVVQLADANNTLSLLAKNVCFSNSAIMCGDALFVLDHDFNVPNINLDFKSFVSNTNPGTFVIYSGGAVKQFHIHAYYAFAASLLKAQDGSEEKAVLDADITSWTDWTASVTMSPFKLSALDGVSFTLPHGAQYDHSSISNPSGMPTSFSDADLLEKNSEIGNATWMGFYIPSITVNMPALVKNTKNSNNNIDISATNLILDNEGLTGIVSASNVVNVGDGSLGGWYCSVDNINLKLLNSSYKTGGLSGKLVMPFSDASKQSSQIAYTCTLSSSTSGSGLVYQFVAQQANNIDFSAWFATININNCSILVTNNTADNRTIAKADLSGNLSLAGNIDGFKIGIDLVDIEHLVVQTQAPYVTVQSAVAGFNSPQHFMADFPISITNIHPVINNGDLAVGLQFDFGLSLSDVSNNLLPSATSTFTVGVKNITSGVRNLWQNSTLELNTVTISGGLAGVVNIKQGSLKFIRNNPVFGNSVEGSLTASFTGLDAVEISTNAKFGKTTFNYWYVDASIKFPQMPVALFLSINALGGGAYYNMTKTDNSNAVEARDYFKNMSHYQIGAYKPQSGSFGFKAKVGVCSSDGYMLNGFGELGMTFNTNNGFSVSSIDGTVYAELMTSVKGDDDNAAVQGAINWHIGIADKVYSINGAVDIRYPSGSGDILDGHGSLVLLADVGNDNYYIKLGEPDNREAVTVAKLFNLSAYFMMGNQISASIPDPDPEIVDVSKLQGYQKMDYNPEAGGLVFGAEFSFTRELDYQIFYLSITAGLGFDISLARYTEGCNGDMNLPGVNGWYGLGQVYAKLTGKFGLQVDLFFYSGRVEALEVGATILLEGGLPNPYWFDGYANFDYNVLDGAVSGSINFHVSVGDKCVPEQNVFKLPLVKQLKPDDQSTNVPINTVPEVYFNYPTEQQFDLVITDNDGKRLIKSYQLVIENCTVINQTTNQLYASYSDPKSNATFEDDGHKQLAMNPVNAFEPQTQYSFNVVVKAQELNNGQWVDSKYHNETVEETHINNFKTGECKPDELISDPKSRLGAYPFPNQRYFLQSDAKQGAIILDKNYSCISNPSEKYDLIARFTAVKNQVAIDTIEKTITSGGGHYLKFDIPKLPNDCIIRVEIIKRTKFTDHDSYAILNSQVPLATTITRAQSGGKLLTATMNYSSYNTMKKQTPSNQPAPTGNKAMQLSKQERVISNQFIKFNGNQDLKLSNKQVDVILYSYHFRTSHYNSLAEKIRNMSYSKTSSYNFDGSPSVQLNAAEKFESYDITGFVSSNYNGSYIYFTLPLVTLKENSKYNSWLRNYASPCVYQQFFNAGINVDNARMLNGTTSYQYLQQVGLTCSADIYCVPLRPIVITSYDSPLSEDEINTDETPDHRASTGMLMVTTFIPKSSIQKIINK